MTINSLVPLAQRMRPLSLDHYIGQEHLIGPQGALRSVVQHQLLPSMILWGPPGVGKTTLANLLCQKTKRKMHALSAIESGVKDLREVIKSAKEQNLFSEGNAVLFIDEIHRFSKSQQDALLGAVEQGIVTLIGATTENPSFEVISALLSRCQVYTLKALSRENLIAIAEQALKEDQYLKTRSIEIAEYDMLLRYSGGDARKLLNALEIAIASQNHSDAIIITNKLVEEVLQKALPRYDKNGEQHYDVISAFIKSIRGSDPQAAVYWLARMIAAGEDPKFIARRMIISSSEDIGLANPTALIMANNCFQAVEKIGMPEGRIILSQTAIYLASSPKSNSAYKAIDLALNDITGEDHYSVPLHLRNAPTQLMKEMGYGKGYRYDHDEQNAFSGQAFLPEEMAGRIYYKPCDNKRENELKQQLNHRWKGRYDL